MIGLEIKVIKKDDGTFETIVENINKPDEKKYRDRKGISLVDIIKDYIVVDIETTGLDSSYNEIIEISALKIKDNRIVDEFSSLIKPQGYSLIDLDDETDDYIIREEKKIRYIDEFIADLTGITNKMLDNAPDILEVLTNFKKFIKEDILIGHNVNFDINFLYDNFIEFLNEPLSNNFIDTLRMARKLLPELRHHRLDDLTEYFNKAMRSEHRALNDCKITNEIYNELTKLALNKYETIDNFKNQFKKKHYTQSVKAKEIKAQTNEFDEEHPLFGKVCVFTGTLEKMVRKDAMQIVVNYGGTCGDTITAKTNYLILGNNDYCKSIKDGKSNKHKKAEKLKLEGQDIEIISENVFYDMIEER